MGLELQNASVMVFEIRTFLILTLLVLSIGDVFSLNTTHNIKSNKYEWKSSFVDHEYIVMFNSYKMTSELNVTMTSIAGPNGWRLIPRTNPGSSLPSDFIVVALEPSHESSILQKLKTCSHIKSVASQRKFTSILSGAWESTQAETTMDQESKTELNEEEMEVKYRPQTQFAKEEEDPVSRILRKLNADPTQIPHIFNAQYLWEEGYSGKGIKVAVFDTGLEDHHPHFKNLASRTDWTDEGTKDDLLGHGTFVAGIIASQSECLGFAPDVELYAFRVFTAQRVSYTAWFLDAFNYAIQKRINILNLSIGGPDFMDRPFVEKVWEMSANKIIIISAIGNDGPVYGTLNNPADHLDVIGVGGIDFKDQVASFSSRGMTTWELPRGSGRVKPDIVAYGQAVQGSGIGGGCKTLSGTSVASPVIAGAVALLASTVPEEKRWSIINPASMKQVLLAGAKELKNANIYEQGAGKLDLIKSFAELASYSPKVTFFPSILDLTDCPYMWPYCTQPLFHGAMPTIFNATILNGMGPSGVIVGDPQWIPSAHGDLLEISFTHSEYLWPWSGWLGIHLRVSAKASKWQGIAQGIVELTVQSPPIPPETNPMTQTVRLPVKVNVIPTPSRAKRILWDQFHNLRYPSAYLPRDALWIKQEPFDWNGDHPFTNFRDLYNHLRSSGFFIDILGDPYTCFNASQYGTLMIVDPEEEFFPEEIEKLKSDVNDHGLSVAVFADWYNEEVMKKINFFDENTKRIWVPITGGSNLPALNDLLKPWQIQFGDVVYDGDIHVQNQIAYFASGTSIAAFPKGGLVIPFPLKEQPSKSGDSYPVPILGFHTPSSAQSDTKLKQDDMTGRIAVFGDSSCLDMAAKSDRKNCFWLAKDILMFTSQGIYPEYASHHNPLESAFTSQRVSLPKRVEGSQLFKFSKVLGHQSISCLNLEFVNINQTEKIPVIDWPAKNVPEATLPLLFREGQNRIPPTRSNNGYGFIGPFLLGGGAALIVVIVFLRISKTRKGSTNSSAVPAHL